MIKNRTYFAGANGEKGFVCYFGTLRARAAALYILKGGCGCGKSALMKKVAAAAKDKGYGVETILCASDPASLDGVYIPALGVGLVDGTAPHELSPQSPGAADTLVDLGRYWDSAALKHRLPEIKALTEKKHAATKAAYSLLAAVGCLREEKHRILSTAVLWDKMYAAATRALKRVEPAGGQFSATLCPRSAFCSTGICHSPNYGETDRVVLKDLHGISHLFYEQLLAAAYSRGVAVTVSPDPLSPERVGAVMTAGGTLFCGDGEGSGRPINMERFLNRDVLSANRQKLRFVNKAIESLSEAARQSMAESRQHHAALEDIYTPTMDFERVNRRTEEIVGQIFA